MCQFNSVKAPRRNPSPPRTAARWLVAAAPLACLTLLSAAPMRAQSVADAARQERARQQADAERATHVYTDEDLAKAKILTPQDRARYAAARKDWITPEDWQLADLPMQRQQPEQSLGEIAWSYRVARMAQQLATMDAPAMPPNHAFALPTFLTAMGEPKRPVDGRAKRAVQANGRTHIPDLPEALPMPNALAYPAFTLTSPAPPAAAATRAATAHVTPDLGLDTSMNLELTPARHGHRVLSEVRPIGLAPSRHEQAASMTATRVEPGDTLWKIAQEKLGSGYRWKEIAAANPRLKASTKILAGEQLRLPFPESFSALRQRTHRVSTGDTLWKLARAAFGNGTAWLCLAHANPGIQNPDLLLPGQDVQIPEQCGVSTTTATSSHVAANLAVK